MSSIEEIELDDEMSCKELNYFDLHDESPIDNELSLDTEEISIDSDNDKDSLQTIEEEEDDDDYEAWNPFPFDDSDESDK